MTQLGYDQPPPDTNEELSQWLSQLTDAINSALSKNNDFPPIYKMPGYQYNGMVRYFGAVVAPDIPIEGLYIKLSTGWQQL